MLKFLKNIFTKKEIEKEEVIFDNIENWLEGKSKNILTDLDINIEQIKVSIKNEIEKTKESLSILKNAELKNTKIPIRAIQAMEGNREAYIKRIGIFLNNIDLNKTDYNEITDFCSNFSNELDSLAKSTFKSYRILQEFFAHESSNIALNIKNIDNHVKELSKAIADSNFIVIENIKKDTKLIKEKIKRKVQLKEEISSLENELIKIKNDRESIEKEIEELKNSEAFANFEKLKKERENIKKDVKEYESIIFHSFSALEKSLKKFSRMIFEDSNTLGSYINDPIDALLNDRELKIIKILSRLKENLHKNKIELDEKKKIKSLNEIEKLNKDFFISFLKTYNDFKEKLDKINRELENNKIENKNSELNNKLNFLNLKVEELENNIDSLKQEIEKIDIQELKNDLQRKINNTLNKNIVIS